MHRKLLIKLWLFYLLVLISFDLVYASVFVYVPTEYFSFFLRLIDLHFSHVKTVHSAVEIILLDCGFVRNELVGCDTGEQEFTTQRETNRI